MTGIEIPIFLTFDDNFVIPGGVAMYSLLKHASLEYHYRFYIAGGRIGPKGRRILDYAIRHYRDRSSIDYLTIDGEINEVWRTLAKTAHFTVEVAYKLFIASVLTQYEKIIISDVDVVFCGDVSEAYTKFHPGEDCLFAGVRPVGMTHAFYDDAYTSAFSPNEILEQKNGISGGFLIADLKGIRESGKERDFIRCFKENAGRLIQSEQDIINLSCSGHLAYLPLRFLVCAFIYDSYRDSLADTVYPEAEIAEALAHPVQLHFPGKPKPWESRRITKSEVWYRYLRESGLAPHFYWIRFTAKVADWMHGLWRKANKLTSLIGQRLGT